MDVELTDQQKQAVSVVEKFLADPDRQVCRVFGYAGVGKSTIAHEMTRRVSGDVRAMTYTGKAASVLRRKGFPAASTIHKGIYKPAGDKAAYVKELEAALAEARYEVRSENAAAFDGDQTGLERAVERDKGVAEIKRKLKEAREGDRKPSFVLDLMSDVRECPMVVIDEVSMVGPEIGQDLERLCKKILVLGDTAQLPPVKGAGYFTETTPDYLLTEIHRQAADNPIIKMATEVRNGRRLPLGSYGDSRVVQINDIDADLALSAGQIIVGRNATRHAYNRRVRQLLGRNDPYPVEGDKLICLRNNHEAGLLNGTIWFATAPAREAGDYLAVTVRPEDGTTEQEVLCHKEYFTWEGDTKLKWWERNEADEFDWGWAITCHKSQGSQWDDVLVVDESYVFRSDADRWLYTAVTRAAERVVVAR